MSLELEHLLALGYVPDVYGVIDYGKLGASIYSVIGGSRKAHFVGVVAAGVNILAANLTPTLPIPVRFRVYAVFNAAGILVVERTVGGVVIPELLNEGNALVAGCAYMFDVGLSGLETINFQYTVPGLALTFIVTEVLP